MSFPAHEEPESESSEPVDADNAASEWSSEEEELDRLYRQALDVVDDIEREMQLPWEVTEVSPDDEDGASETPTTLPFPSTAFRAK